MAADQTPAVEFFSVMSDLVTIGAAVVGAVAAWRAVDTWRSQIRGQATFDAAKKLMDAANELAMRFHDARAPYIDASEFPEGFDLTEASRRTGMGEETRKAYMHVFNKRWQPVDRCYSQVISLVPEARTLFPSHVGDSALSLLLTARKLKSRMEMYADSLKYGDPRRSVEPGSLRDKLLALQRTAADDLFAVYGKPADTAGDPFTREFVGHHEALASALRPFLLIT